MPKNEHKTPKRDVTQRENHETVPRIASGKSGMLQDKQEALQNRCGRAAVGSPTAPAMKIKRNEFLRPSGRTA